MRKRAVSAIMLALLLIAVSTSVFNFYSVKATPGTYIYIRADGSVDPPAAPIQRDGDVYTFTNDITYPTYEGIVVQKSNIIIDGNGYTLQGSGDSGTLGFDLTSMSNVIIEDTNIEYFNYGIWLNSSTFNTVSGNTITNNYLGVFLIESSNDNDISGNTLTNNHDAISLYWSSCSNTVSGNTITNNNDGIYLLESSNFNIISENTIVYNDYYGVCLDTSCDSNTVSGNTITNNEVGVALLDLCSSNNISGNTITDNDDSGVGLRASSFNTVSGNIVTANSYCGIVVFRSESSNNNISGNNIRSNYHGVWLWESSYNTVSGNTITNNNDGVCLSDSSSNIFYHNSFMDNILQVNITAPGFANVWDDGYPSGGNYWSDYTGVDNYSGPNQDQPGSDGIGDTPYVIDADNVDYYPLFPPHPVHNIDTGLNYTTVQDAIDAPETLNGHTIFVEERTYYEHVVVYKSLSLVGADKFNTIIDGNFTGRVIEVTADNVSITGFTIQHCGTGSYDSGIYASSSGNNMSYNIITNNPCGVLLDSSTFSTLSGNTITNNYRGVWLIYSYNNTVSRNTITNNGEDGISIAGGSRDNTVSGNTITNNDIGVSLWFSFFNTVCGNNITNNNNGVRLYMTLNSTVCGNNITNNNNGVYLYFGYENNTFYHNNFIDNIQQVYIDTPGFPNSWDNGYPSGGNYWSDYTGVDEKSGPNQDQPGSDGIGDTPYTIDAYNQDQYPLMTPYTPQYNIATTNITPSKTVVGQGYSMSINVTVENQGDFPETFSVTTYYDDTPIETKTVTNLPPSEDTTINFTWNTIGVAKGEYTISAYATPVLGETDTADNTLEDGTVKVTVPGDADGDGEVDTVDLSMLGRAWDTSEAEPHNELLGTDWNPNCDFNGDTKIKAEDISVMGAHWG